MLIIIQDSAHRRLTNHIVTSSDGNLPPERIRRVRQTTADRRDSSVLAVSTQRDATFAPSSERGTQCSELKRRRVYFVFRCHRVAENEPIDSDFYGIKSGIEIGRKFPPHFQAQAPLLSGSLSSLLLLPPSAPISFPFFPYSSFLCFIPLFPFFLPPVLPLLVAQ